MSSNDTPWAGDEGQRRWDFHGDPDNESAAFGYEAALPGLQSLTAPEAPSIVLGAQAS